MTNLPSSKKNLKTSILDALTAGCAQNICILDVETDITDQIVICTVTSKRHACALAERVVMATKAQGFRSSGVEGEAAGEWILIDFLDVMVHIMLQSVRDLYKLEELWAKPKDKASAKSDSCRPNLA